MSLASNPEWNGSSHSADYKLAHERSTAWRIRALMRCQTQCSEKSDRIETARFLDDCLHELQSRLSDARTLGKRTGLLLFVPHWAFTATRHQVPLDLVRKDYRNFLDHLRERGHTVETRLQRPRFGQVVGFNPVIAVYIQVQPQGGAP